MDDLTAIFEWENGVFRLLDDEHEHEHERRLEVADSFLVDSGRVLALDVHRERFITSAAARGFDDAASIDAFWTESLELLPREAQWFPRFELIARDRGFGLRLRLRVAPVLARTATLTTYRDGDPRTEPTIKGPDLDVLMRIRETARRTAGSDDVVILRDGFVCDAATSALLWWRDDRLIAPPATLPRVASVTARAILAIASATGVTLGEESVAPAELAGCEVWAVNALHGIRLVTGWTDGPALSAAHPRADLWRPRLRALARPLP